MTVLVSGFPCIGKTTLGNSNKYKYMDLEFRETASSRGMSKKDTFALYENYIQIIKNIYSTGYYDYLLITDNEFLLNKVVENNLPLTYVIPNPEDKDFLIEHKNRVISRNDLIWYQNIIEPRLSQLKENIEKIENYPKGKVIYLTKEKPYLKNVLGL